MQIDDRVEAMVRRILNAVVRANDAEYYAALGALPDDQTRTKALELALTICAYTVLDAFDGEVTPAELALTAEGVVRMAHWMSLEKAEVNAFLTAILDGSSLDGIIEPMTVAMLGFIVTGTLLAASPKIREGQRWFNYLDQVEANIEATPELYASQAGRLED